MPVSKRRSRRSKSDRKKRKKNPFPRRSRSSSPGGNRPSCQSRTYEITIITTTTRASPPRTQRSRLSRSRCQCPSRCPWDCPYLRWGFLRCEGTHHRHCPLDAPATLPVAPGNRARMAACASPPTRWHRISTCEQRKKNPKNLHSPPPFFVVVTPRSPTRYTRTAPRRPRVARRRGRTNTLHSTGCTRGTSSVGARPPGRGWPQ